MELRTIIDQIEVRPGSGDVQVRFLKQVVNNGGTVVVQEPHRTRFVAGGDVDAQMAAVNQHLEAMGYPAVTDYSSIAAHCALAHNQA